MDLSAVKEGKLQLEFDICTLVHKFEIDYGLAVTSIDMDRVDIYSLNNSQETELVRVGVDLKVL